MSDCLFCKIIAGDIPCSKLYEDDDILAFWDISPQAPKHFLIIPKKHLNSAADAAEEDDKLIGKLIRVGADLAAQNGIAEGFRIISNNGAPAGQIIFHLHLHFLGGKPMSGLLPDNE